MRFKIALAISIIGCILHAPGIIILIINEFTDKLPIGVYNLGCTIQMWGFVIGLCAYLFAGLGTLKDMVFGAPKWVINKQFSSCLITLVMIPVAPMFVILISLAFPIIPIARVAAQNL